MITADKLLAVFNCMENISWNRHFWCRGYYVDTVGRNKAAITKYIQNQIQEDQIAEQISMKEIYRPVYGRACKR